MGRALVCTPDTRIRDAVSAAGYEVVDAGVDPVEHLRHEKFDLVALDGLPARDTASFLDGLVGGRRRELFVLKVDERFTTGDRLQNWSESADLVAHPDDLGRLAELVAAARREKEEFYRVFRAVQEESGVRLGAHA